MEPYAHIVCGRRKVGVVVLFHGKLTINPIYPGTIMTYQIYLAWYMAYCVRTPHAYGRHGGVMVL